MPNILSGEVGRLDFVDGGVVKDTDTLIINTRKPGEPVNTFLAKATATQVVEAGFSGLENLTVDNLTVNVSSSLAAASADSMAVTGSLSGGTLTVTGATTLDTGLTGGLEATAGLVSAYTLTTAGKDLLDDATPADQRTTLGLGDLATLNTVDTAQIEDNAVTTAKIDDLAVTTPKIDGLAVTTAKIDALAVTTAKLNDLAVTTAKIDDLAVTEGKLSTDVQDKLNQPGNTVFVTDVSDFPTPAANVITLDVNITYVIIGNVSVGINTIVMSSGSVLQGRCSANDILTFTGGSGNFITISDVSTCIKDLGVVASGAIGYLIRNTGGNEKTDSVLLQDVTFSGGQFLDIENIKSVKAINYTVISATINGITATGSQNGCLKFIDGEFESFTGTAIDFENSVSDFIEVISNVFVDIAGGQTGIDGVASSANLSAGGIGIIQNNQFNGAGTYLANITVGDLQWVSRDNTNLPNSEIIGEMYLSANATPTLISATGVYTKVAGTTTASSLNERTSMPLDNRIQFDALKDTKGTVWMSVAAENVGSGVIRDYEFALFKNGAIENALVSTEGTYDENQANLSWQQSVSLTNGDYFEVFIRNNENTDDALVISMQFTLIGAI
jgi:hypothetical protein